MASSSHRVLRLPVFPIRPDSENTSPEGRALAARFSPNELLGGFLVGPENRLAELAARFATEGAPVFDRPLGAGPLSPIVSASREPSRADFEALFRAAVEEPDRIDRLYGDRSEGASPFERDRYNALRSNPDEPKIVGYRPLETIEFLSPLVFYGPSGSGKTRLVEGICQYRRTLAPNKTLYYLSCSDFVNALTDAIRREQTQLFRSLFSQASAIAIENADVLAEKETAQIEFLPLLDAAIKAKKLVVLTFSQLPSAIRGLSSELIARLSAGLLAPVRLPTFDTRRKVVDLSAEKLGLKLDESSRALFAERGPASIGALCASLAQFARETTATRTVPTLEAAEGYLARRAPLKEWPLDSIVKTIAKYLGVSVVEMRGKKRTKTLVFARNCVVFFARRLTDASFQEIGALFSNRDHSTMIHGVKAIDEARQNDPDVARALEEIAAALRAEDRI